MAETKINGIESLEIGDIGVDGAPGASLTPITAIQLESVTITIPGVDTTDLHVEELDQVYDSLDNAEPDPITISFASYNADNDELARIFGGTVNAGKYTLNRSGAQRTVVLKSKPRGGRQKVFTFPVMVVRPNMDSVITKSDLTAVAGLGTAITPVDNSGASPVYLPDHYMEDVLVP